MVFRKIKLINLFCFTLFRFVPVKLFILFRFLDTMWFVGVGEKNEN